MGYSSLFSDPVSFFLNILYRIPGIIVAFTVHEFMHAFVAVRMGDNTPRAQGRLTLNPSAHLDWVGCIMLLLFGYGWAKPVSVRPGSFKHPKLGDFLVSLAGPLSNLLLGVLLFPLLLHVSVPSIAPFLSAAYSINLALFFLNILPVPPLDGFHIVKSFFGLRHLKFFWNIERYGFLLLVALAFTGILGTVISYGSGAVTTFLLWVFVR